MVGGGPGHFGQSYTKYYPPIPYSKLGSTKLHLFQSFNVKHLKMKPTVVAQDEMFPDGDAGWMEMDEVTTVLYKAL